MVDLVKMEVPGAEAMKTNISLHFSADSTSRDYLIVSDDRGRVD